MAEVGGGMAPDELFKVNGQRLKQYWGGVVDQHKTSITLADLP